MQITFELMKDDKALRMAALSPIVLNCALAFLALQYPMSGPARLYHIGMNRLERIHQKLARRHGYPLVTVGLAYHFC